ncbi:MAG: ArsR family transcriptional regulator [Candidatus Lokiarchaeota archaeon]|nr:ArsR family transcriptional regulator [Candidatus Lokiarchaeota archaeon]MBD3198601.1 ArsR family transcriptional regulator [Candidatus Lokiarchaeota archaeon]
MNEQEFLIEDLLGSRARVKILKVLAINCELNITSIVKKTRLNHTNVKKHLEFLEERSLVQEKRFGRIKIFRYKIENIKARSFKNFLEIWENKC